MTISFEEAKRLLDSEPDAVMLDVREEEEYITGHADEAVLLPVDELSESAAAELIADTNTPVLVYCRTGQRSARAAEKLKKYGYKHVYDVGSLIGWPYGLS